MPWGYPREALQPAFPREAWEREIFFMSPLLRNLICSTTTGLSRERKEADANIEEGLNLIESLGKPELAKSVGKVRRTLPDLFNYF